MGIEHCDTFLVFHKFFPCHKTQIMKLSTIFVFAAAAESKKVRTPEFEIEKLKTLIEFVWKQWFVNCDVKHGQRKDRYKQLADRVLVALNKCQVRRLALEGEAPARRRRDETSKLDAGYEVVDDTSEEEDYWWEEDEEDDLAPEQRISKTD